MFSFAYRHVLSKRGAQAARSIKVDRRRALIERMGLRSSVCTGRDDGAARHGKSRVGRERGLEESAQSELLD